MAPAPEQKHKLKTNHFPQKHQGIDLKAALTCWLRINCSEYDFNSRVYIANCWRPTNVSPKHQSVIVRSILLSTVQ